MTELYSVPDAARIFGLRPARLRYWLQSGFYTPSVRRGGQFFYTFRDLVSLKAAVGLLDAGVPLSRVRQSVAALRADLPEDSAPLTKLRVVSDGAGVVAIDGDAAYEPGTGQLVMAFAVESLAQKAAEVVKLAATHAAPHAVTDAEVTQPTPLRSAYQWFCEGNAALERGEMRYAEVSFRHAIELEPAMAAAHANLGAVHYRSGDSDSARAAFEAALERAPDLAEARYNLALVLAEAGDHDLAIAELRRVCQAAPDFADACFNLGALIARVGGKSQARAALSLYLERFPESAGAPAARAYLGATA
ncbi:MAG TPA: tetratricopeptide repeat protein [Kofleriaceae bacterium]|nr:tetratricopeptide repeat protein [Kofleriaceae bacterium]